MQTLQERLKEFVDLVSREPFLGERGNVFSSHGKLILPPSASADPSVWKIYVESGVIDCMINSLSPATVTTDLMELAYVFDRAIPYVDCIMRYGASISRADVERWRANMATLTQRTIFILNACVEHLDDVIKNIPAIFSIRNFAVKVASFTWFALYLEPDHECLLPTDNTEAAILAVFCIMFDNRLHSPRLKHVDRSTFLLSAEISKKLLGAVGERSLKVLDTIYERYGPDKLAQECVVFQRLSQHVNWGEVGIVQHLHSVGNIAFCQALANRRYYYGWVSAAWKSLKVAQDDRAYNNALVDAHYRLFVLTRLLQTLVVDPSEPGPGLRLVGRVTRELLKEQDLIMLFGKILSIHQRMELGKRWPHQEDPLPLFLQVWPLFIREACKKDNRLLEDYCKEPWSYVLMTLRDLQSKNILDSTPLMEWANFARKINLSSISTVWIDDSVDPGLPRSAMFSCTIGATNKESVCSFFKCPLGFAVGLGVGTMLRCGGCGQVQYCSTQCRRGDWVSYHRRVCKLLASRQDTGHADEVD